MKKLLYLVRHGQSEANAANIHGGHIDSPLSEVGRAQAAAARPSLEGIHFDTVFCSDLSRAKETGAIMLPDANFVCRKDLREINVGSLGGRARKECLAEYGAVYTNAVSVRDYSPFGGESFADFQGRIVSFLDELIANDYGERVAVFGHGGFIEGVIRHAIGYNFPSGKIVITNCSVWVLEYRNNAWMIRACNYTPHIKY